MKNTSLLKIKQVLLSDSNQFDVLHITLKLKKENFRFILENRPFLLLYANKNSKSKGSSFIRTMGFSHLNAAYNILKFWKKHFQDFFLMIRFFSLYTISVYLKEIVFFKYWSFPHKWSQKIENRKIFLKKMHF